MVEVRAGGGFAGYAHGGGQEGLPLRRGGDGQDGVRAVRAALLVRIKDDRMREPVRFRPLLTVRIVAEPLAGPRVADCDGQFLGHEVGASRGSAQLGERIDPDLTPKVLIAGQRGLIRHEILQAGALAIIAGLGPGDGADLVLDDAGGGDKRRGLPAGELLNGNIHELRPDRSRTRQPGRALHRGVIRVAHPDTDREIGRETQGPIIPKVIRGPGLGRHLERQVEDRVGPEFWCASDVVRKYGVDQKGVLRADYLFAGRRLILEDRLAIVGGDPRDCDRWDPTSSVRKDRVGSGQLQGRDRPAAQSESQPVVGAGQGRNPQTLSHPNHAVAWRQVRIVVDSDKLKGLHGRNVEGIRQGGAHRDRPVEKPIIVDRLIRRVRVARVAGGRKLGGHVPD